MSKLKLIHIDAFILHLNSQHERINFTRELQEQEKLPFLDTVTHVLPDRTTKTTIHRKATHTDQYLDFRSNHHVKQKLGIYGTFKHRACELITTEEDQQKELNHVKRALKRCGYPNWSFNRKKKRKPKEKVERRGKVVIPYTKGLSENLAKVFRRYDIETIHKPSATLKNIICNKMKDQVHVLDKTGAVYYNKCKRHDDPKNDYVGETDRVWRGRQYEHGVVDHKTANRSASINHPEDPPEPTRRRPSTRSQKRNQPERNYATMHHGTNQKLTLGSTEFSAHLASEEHEKDDIESKLLCTEEDWFRRGVKEAIAIRKINPTLNQDDGRHNLSTMYNKLIRSSEVMTFPRQGTKGATDSRSPQN